jgi:hypothetical protein
MELNLHPIATKCFVSGRDFAENDRVVCYLAREASGEIIRRDLLEAEDTGVLPPAAGPELVERAFVYCRWVVGFKQRKAGENPALTLKLTAENLFLTLATPVNPELVERALPGNVPEDTILGTFAPAQAGGRTLGREHSSTGHNNGATSTTNTPLLQFLTLMLERKKLIKPRGLTEDGARQIYEHMPSHQLYEVPIGDLNQEFFQRIQEHLGVLVGAPKARTTTGAPVPAEPAPVVL